MKNPGHTPTPTPATPSYHFSEDSQNGIIERALVDANGRWIPMPELMALADSGNVHSRINDLRDYYAIQNRQVPDHTRGKHRRLSFYRIPTAEQLAAEEAALAAENASPTPTVSAA